MCWLVWRRIFSLMFTEVFLGVLVLALLATGGWLIGERYDDDSMAACVAAYAWVTVIVVGGTWLMTR